MIMGSEITPMTHCDYTKIGLNLRKRAADAGIDHSYAENTMREMLGWYGYDRRDEIAKQRRGNITATVISSDKNHEGEPIQRFEEPFIEVVEEIVEIHPRVEDGRSVIIKQEHSEENRLEEPGELKWRSPVIIKSEVISPNSDNKECSWCGKQLLFCEATVSAPTGDRYCSENCFAQSRRASFKRAKICDWCRHIRHTVSHEEYQGATSALQFCSDKCLNQYKMHIFCRETQTQLEQHPHLRASLEQAANGPNGSQNKEGLITPELWLLDCRDNSSSSSVDGRSIVSTSPSKTPSQQNTIDVIALPNKPQTHHRPVNAPEQQTNLKLLRPLEGRAANHTRVISTPPAAPARAIKPRENKRRKLTANNNIPLVNANLRCRTPVSTIVAPPTATRTSITPVISNFPEHPINPAIHFSNRNMSPYLMGASTSATNSIPPNFSGVPMSPVIQPRPFIRFQQPPRPHQQMPHQQMPHQQMPHQQMLPRYGMYQQPMAGPPPVTVLVPYPVVMPLPMPIPIPIPLPFETFVCAYSRDSGTSSISTPTSDLDFSSPNMVQVRPLDFSIRRNIPLEEPVMPPLFYLNQEQNESSKVPPKKSRKRRKLVNGATR